MAQNKKKKIKKTDDEDSRDSRGIEALAAFTSSDVVAQLKFGLSRLGPIEGDESQDDIAR